jgi:hypothetical protein
MAGALLLLMGDSLSEAPLRKEAQVVNRIFTLPRRVDFTLTSLGQGSMRALRSSLFLLFAAALPVAAGAQVTARQSAAPRAGAGAALIFPLTLTTSSNLDFGYVAATGAGTVVIDPNSGGITTTGLVLAMGGNPRPASFIGAARSASVVNIRVPRQPILIRRIGGTETMTVRDFTLQGQEKRSLARMEAFGFNVGATLIVPAGQAEGTYSGEFDVTVHYP